MSNDMGAVLVTGAKGDIGRAIARRLRADGYGVIATDRAAEPRDEANPNFVAADLRSVSDRRRIVDAVGPRLHGFVHAAGIILSQSIADISDEDWDASFDVNVKSGFFLARDLLPRLANGGGVVMIGSVAGQRASPENLVYAATKAGLRSIAGSLAVAFASQNVRVNVVAPGLIATGSTEIATEALSAIRGQPRDDVWKARLQGIPQGRPGRPDDVANAVAWLLSDQSGYVTGATLAVNGGLLAGS